MFIIKETPQKIKFSAVFFYCKEQIFLTIRVQTHLYKADNIYPFRK